MNKSFNLSDILNEKSDMPSAYMHVSDWFCATWHCSYIRYVAVRTWKEFELSVFLAWILRKDPSHPELSPEEWLRNCTLLEIDKEQVEKWVAHAKSDYEEEKLQEGSNVEGTQFPILNTVTSDLKWAFEIRGETKPCNKRLAGPTYITFWQSGEWMYYLEIHNES